MTKIKVLSILAALVLVWLGASVYLFTPAVEKTEAALMIPASFRPIVSKLIADGVIDLEKLKKLDPAMAEQALLIAAGEGEIVVTASNGRLVLNLLWGLGLSQKTKVLTHGPMMDPKYGGAGGFASTGGWTLAHTHAMDHYASHQYFDIDEKDEIQLERVAKQIYRPCCGNSTYFPDCNHGMAMLALVELLVEEGQTDEDILATAAAINELWFPPVEPSTCAA